TDWDAFAAVPMDFAVVSVKRGAVTDVVRQLRQRDIAVLCETPPAESLEDLKALWAEQGGAGVRFQVAEQYFLQPLYAAWLEAIRLGLLGAISNVNLSAVHGYHASSLIRRLLGLRFPSFVVSGKVFRFPLTNTGSRAGLDVSGTVGEAVRHRLEMTFDNGQVAFIDFSGSQYHSTIRTRQLTVQGSRGEIDDLTVRYLGTDNRAITQVLERIDRGVYNNTDWSHDRLMLGGICLYATPLAGARLNDDELAVATCLLEMARSLTDGKPFYGLADALEDASWALLWDEALAKSTPVVSVPQPWHS
ncbi:MAG: Gfo/Idh/MocA family oxidoreductase, partial [Spirochaetales bacterium]